MWPKISNFARELGNPDDFIVKAKKDFDELVNQFITTINAVSSTYTSEERNNSLSMQHFYRWVYGEQLSCFYMLYFANFRHAALRELRFYFESRARAYYIDTEHKDTTYNCKQNILKEIRWKHFQDLLKGLPRKERKKLKKFYDDLCDYIHLSEIVETDALGDSGLGLVLGHPYYEKDKDMLRKAFEYSKYLFLCALKRKNKHSSN